MYTCGHTTMLVNQSGLFVDFTVCNVFNIFFLDNALFRNELKVINIIEMLLVKANLTQESNCLLIFQGCVCNLRLQHCKRVLDLEVLQKECCWKKQMKRSLQPQPTKMGFATRAFLQQVSFFRFPKVTYAEVKFSQ